MNISASGVNPRPTVGLGVWYWERNASGHAVKRRGVLDSISSDGLWAVITCPGERTVNVGAHRLFHWWEIQTMPSQRSQLDMLHADKLDGLRERLDDAFQRAWTEGVSRAEVAHVVETYLRDKHFTAQVIAGLSDAF